VPVISLMARQRQAACKDRSQTTAAGASMKRAPIVQQADNGPSSARREVGIFPSFCVPSNLVAAPLPHRDTLWCWERQEQKLNNVPSTPVGRGRPSFFALVGDSESRYLIKYN